MPTGPDDSVRQNQATKSDKVSVLEVDYGDQTAPATTEDGRRDSVHWKK
jgi:hypothetical protein